MQTPGLRPRPALPRLRAAPTEPALGGGRGASRKGGGEAAASCRPPTARSSSSGGSNSRQRQPHHGRAAAAAVVLLLPPASGGSSGSPPPPPQSSSSISSPAELLPRLVRRAPDPRRAAASRPQSSRLDRQPAIFRVRRPPDGDGCRPCIRTDSEGGYRSSVRLGPQVRVGGEGSGGNQSHWACEFIHTQRLRPAMKPTTRDRPWPAHCSEQRKGAGARRSQSRVAPQGSQRAARRRRGSAPSPGRLRGPAQEQQQTHQARQTQQQNDPSG